MKFLIVTSTAAAQIESVNAQQNGKRRMQWRVDVEGRKLLPASLLTDCATGQTWQDYREIIENLDTVDAASVQWPEDPEP